MSSCYFRSFILTFISALAPLIAITANDTPKLNVPSQHAPPSTKLKIRQPNWPFKILTAYPDGSPKTLLLYEPIQGDKEIPVKLLVYASEGSLYSETDLMALKSNENPPYIPHGPSLIYNQDGTVDTITFYDQGMLYQSIKTFYPTGQLRSFIPIKNGLYHGTAEKYFANGELAERNPYVDGIISGTRLQYYQNGKKASQRKYKNALLHGEMSEWYSDGNTKTVAFYTNGLLNAYRNHNAFTSFHPNGKMAEIQNFRQGQPEGPHVLIHPNGKESYRVNYVEGKKHGPESFLTQEGLLVGEGEYCKGIPCGKHIKTTPEGGTKGTLVWVANYDAEGSLLEPIKEFYPNGAKKSQYYLMNDHFIGEYLDWFPNGNLNKHHLYNANGEFNGLQQEYYDNEKLKLRVIYKNNVKHGLYEEWYLDGKPSVSIAFENGIKHGASNKWFPNGQKSTETFYQEGLPEGTNLEWHDNGKLKIKSEYAKGLRSGLFQEWFSEGNVKYSAHFSNGNLEGIAEEYYANAKPASRGNYKNGKLNGDWLSWHENGSPHEIFHYSHGIPIGEHIIYFPAQDNQTPQISHRKNYLEGKLDGEQKSFYADGQLKAIMNYKNGLLHGKKALWDHSNKLLEEAFYVEGSLDGRYYLHRSDDSEIIYHYQDNQLQGLHQIFYPPNEFFGKVKALEATYHQGQLEGEVAEYNEAGTKVASTNYQKGLKEGIASIYNNDGRLNIAAEFHHDNQNGMTYEYHPNGLIKKEVLFVEDLKEGQEKSFHANGQIAAITNYFKGKINGTSSQWNKKGILIFEAVYRDGKRHGKFNKYDAEGNPILSQTYSDDQLTEKKSPK